ISPLLPTGLHQNVTINLGDFYEGGKELIVMIYTDNGDLVFNDNDKPYVDESGHITARYVSNGTVVAQSLLKSNSVSQGHVMGGAPMPRVRYTNAGFVPVKITVKVGTMVEFVNESNGPMWVASNEHPEHAFLPTFDQFETVDSGAAYTYVFDKPGEWPFHDHINPALEGVIIAE
ncbi:MAG: cupredoxin domain-containing protein, partial [Patescibacteria group bacterium]